MFRSRFTGRCILKLLNSFKHLLYYLFLSSSVHFSLTRIINTPLPGSYVTERSAEGNASRRTNWRIATLLLLVFSNGSNRGEAQSARTHMHEEFGILFQTSSTMRSSYRLDGHGVGVRVPVGVTIFTSPRRPDRLWGPPNLLSNGYRGLFRQG
jgi:hypothetical protein